MKNQTHNLDLRFICLVPALLLLLASCNPFEEKLPDKFEVSITEDTSIPGSELQYSTESCEFAFKYAPGDTKKKSAFTLSTSEKWMGKTEVTYQLWKEIYDWAIENGYTLDSDGQQGSDESNSTNQHPVTVVCWFDALVWCNALTEYYNAYNGDRPDYDFCYLYKGVPIRNSEIDNPEFDNLTFDDDADGFRIPSNNEWIAAASYKNLPEDYASGANANFENEQVTGTVAWHRFNSDMTTHIVATRLPNALGIFDMSGNVSEIMYDPLDIYDGKYAIRGGAWNSNLSELQICESHPVNRYTSSYSVGFRICRNLTDEHHDDIETVENDDTEPTIEEGGTGSLTINDVDYEISKAILYNFNSIEAGYFQLVFLSDGIDMELENSGGYTGTGNMVHIMVVTEEDELKLKTYNEDNYSMIDFTADINCYTDVFPWTMDINFIGYDQEVITVEKDGDDYVIRFSCSGSIDYGDTRTTLSGSYTGSLVELDAGVDF